MFTIDFDGEAETLIHRRGKKAIANDLNREEKDLHRKIRKALQHLEANPRPPGLKSHQIDVLTENTVCVSGNLILRTKKPGLVECFGYTGQRPKKLQSSA